MYLVVECALSNGKCAYVAFAGLTLMCLCADEGLLKDEVAVIFVLLHLKL